MRIIAGFRTVAEDLVLNASLDYMPRDCSPFQELAAVFIRTHRFIANCSMAAHMRHSGFDGELHSEPNLSEFDTVNRMAAYGYSLISTAERRGSRNDWAHVAEYHVCRFVGGQPDGRYFSWRSGIPDANPGRVPLFKLVLGPDRQKDKVVLQKTLYDSEAAAHYIQSGHASTIWDVSLDSLNNGRAKILHSLATAILGETSETIESFLRQHNQPLRLNPQLQAVAG